MSSGGIEIPITFDINEHGCHICTSHKTREGRYPKCVRNKKIWKISRLKYLEHKGEIPKGLIIRHTCDNRMCINPDHLILGTHKQNAEDRKLRNRNGDQNGVKNHMSKLSEDQIKEIREINNLPTAKIAKIYNVSQTLISKIKRRKLWNHIP